MQANELLRHRIKPTTIYIIAAIFGLAIGTCIGLVVGKVHAVEQQQTEWRNQVYKQKYDQAVIKHLTKPTPKPKKQALVTAYSCVGITTAGEKAMNCPNGISASGMPLVPYKTAACDRANMGRVFNLEGIGEVTCVDVGGAIKGAGRFDLYVTDIQTAYQWGKQTVAYELVE